jgi:hypothetical protein
MRGHLNDASLRLALPYPQTLDLAGKALPGTNTTAYYVKSLYDIDQRFDEENLLTLTLSCINPLDSN